MTGNSTLPPSYNEAFSLPESTALILYLITALFLGGLGNAVIIHASRKYTSFSLDKITILFVQHLAVADLLKVVFMVCPMLASHVYYLGFAGDVREYREWLLPNPTCKVFYSLVVLSNNASLSFVVAVSVHRLARCVAPTKLHLVTTQTGRAVAGALWALAVLCAVAVFFIPAAFQIYGTVCIVDFNEVLVDGFRRFVRQYVNYPLIATEILIVFICNLASLLYTYTIARKHGQLNLSNFKQANLTVLALSSVMILSYAWLPYLMVSVYVTKRKVLRSDLKYTIPMTTLGGLLDPLIYAVVNRGFKRFVVGEVRRFVRRFGWTRVRS